MINQLQKKLKLYNDFPKKGVIFQDICPLLADPVSFKTSIKLLCQKLSKVDFDFIVGLQSRGFIIGAALAYELNKGFIPIRKPGKLPGKLIRTQYVKQYGSDVFQMQQDALPKGAKVIIVDDLIAVGGTMLASIELLQKVEAKIQACVVYIAIKQLNGKQKIEKKVKNVIVLFD